MNGLLKYDKLSIMKFPNNNDKASQSLCELGKSHVERTYESCRSQKSQQENARTPNIIEDRCFLG